VSFCQCCRGRLLRRPRLRRLAALGLGLSIGARAASSSTAASGVCAVGDLWQRCLGQRQDEPQVKSRFAPLPDEVANAVSATAAESLLMGMFVLICAFELRGVKAGYSGPQNGFLPSSRYGSAHKLQRGVSTPADTTQVAPPIMRQRSCPPSAFPADEDLGMGSIYGIDENLLDINRPGVSGHCSRTEGWNDEDDKWHIAPLILMMILLHVIYPSFPISPQVEMGRIMTFLGFLWSVGPQRCISV
ncbi:unnamed protein product, partial [Polarella glacialis]